MYLSAAASCQAKPGHSVYPSMSSWPIIQDLTQTRWKGMHTLVPGLHGAHQPSQPGVVTSPLHLFLPPVRSTSRRGHGTWRRAARPLEGGDGGGGGVLPEGREYHTVRLSFSRRHGGQRTCSDMYYSATSRYVMKLGLGVLRGALSLLSSLLPPHLLVHIAL